MLLQCSVVQLNLTEAVQESNEKHMSPWSEMCSVDNIHTTPLSPFIDQVFIITWSPAKDHVISSQELLYNRSLSVDGSAIEATGFHYTIAEPTVHLLREVSTLL